MRKRGDHLLPVPCSKSTAVQLLNDALNKRSLISGKQLAEEFFGQNRHLNPFEKILICALIYAACDGKPPAYVDQLWSEALDDLPRRYYDDVADVLIRLAELFTEQGNQTRAWNALYAAEQYAESGANRLHYNAALQAYEELKKPKRLGTVIDIRA